MYLVLFLSYCLVYRHLKILPCLTTIAQAIKASSKQIINIDFLLNALFRISFEQRKTYSQ